MYVHIYYLNTCPGYAYHCNFQIIVTQRQLYVWYYYRLFTDCVAPAALNSSVFVCGIGLNVAESLVS